MKQLIYLLCILFTINIKAQDEKCFTKGTSAINLGVGIGSSVNNYDNTSVIKPIYNGSYEYGITKVGPGIIGAGVTVSYMNYSLANNYYGGLFGFPGNYSYKTTLTTTVIGLRATYHPDFCNGKKYDVYGAVQLNIYDNGILQTSNNSNYPSSHSHSINQILPSLLVGARYFFIPNFGVFAEFGYDFAVIKGGLSFKFGGK